MIAPQTVRPGAPAHQQEFRYFPAVPIGTVSVQTPRVLGIVSTDSSGFVVRGLDIFLRGAIAPSNSDYWIIEIGTLGGGGTFFPKSQYARPFQGLALGRNTVEFPTKVGYAIGDVVAVRVTPRGTPAALTNCDVVLLVQEP